MEGASGRFRRTDRLRTTREYRRVSRSRHRASSEAFVVLVGRGESAESRCRLGLTVSRKVGGAVARNRVKRRVREWFRWKDRRITGGLDIVVIARRRAATMSGSAIREELDRLLRIALEVS